SAITVHLDIKRLEQILFKLDTRAEISAFLQAHPLFAKQFLSLSPHNTPERMIERLYAMIHNPGMQDLYQEVQRIFGDLTAVEQQLNQAFQYLQYYYPDFQVPQVATFITGMGTDLYVSKDLIVLGLDFFMGKGAKYRPQELPQYLLRTYQPENIVPKTMLRLARQFIQTAPKDRTLLADMLYYGKAYYFVKALLPEVDEYLLLGYTQKQLADVQRHQRLIWEHFIEQKLLYTTKRLCKNKYIDERPFTAEIGQSCPGKIGRWLGWAIIKKYMQDHPHVHLSALLKNPNAKSLFIQSKYRPER
ncbi:MAG: gliding motility lipoprotein GldB, partial [Bacteroidota bacterium]